MMAGLVSRRWHYTAYSPQLWRDVFNRDYYQGTSDEQHLLSPPLVGGLGLGRSNANQEWKQMWKVRKALSARWHDGHAAAIYLEGHEDTVYCVQFDK